MQTGQPDSGTASQRVCALAAEQQAAGETAAAIQTYRSRLALKPDDVQALDDLSKALRRAERPWEAVEPLEKALALSPRNPIILTNLGYVLTDLGRVDEAVRHLRCALASGISGDALAEAHHALGRALLWRGDVKDAFGALQQALALKCDMVEPRLLWAQVLLEQGQLADAIASLRRTVQLAPRSADAHCQLGDALSAAGQTKAALAEFDTAIAIDPRSYSAHAFRGALLARCRRLPEALASLRTAGALRPDDAYPDARALYCHVHMCDWQGVRCSAERLRRGPRGMSAADVFSAMAVSDDPAELLRVARVQSTVLARRRLPMAAARYSHDRIRVAYLSRDFRSHATAFLMAELLEMHDRAAVKIYGVSYGPDDGSVMRRRIASACECFIDVAGKSDQEVASWLRAEEIDIAVDLKGYTESDRSGIFAYRPAPIQVSYLGFPGSMGAPFIDYLIADAFVIPEAERCFYEEKIAYLPGCYQVNDRKRRIAERTPERVAMGLPPRGFVFCCFNNNWKITEEVFEVWMRLLQAVEGSVLWLLGDNPWAEQNLRREASERGVAAERLIFAGRMGHEEHLARHRLADLFLDTLPVNAHTTASDALWTGLPIVTCAGRSFAARVAGSLLHAVGLAELVTTSLEEYEQLALALAREPQRLRGLRAKLLQNRATFPLFDTPRFCKHLEAAYRQMWLTQRDGKPPETFSVQPLGIEVERPGGSSP